MDQDDALPPPIRRFPGQNAQKQGTLFQQVLNDREEDNLNDDASPPPISRQRSASLHTESSTFNNTDLSYTPPLPKKSEFRARPNPSQTQSSVGSSPARNFSHPFTNLSRKPTPIVQTRGPVPNRRPVKSYHRNHPLRPSLKRWSSLETIESVATTPSIDEGLSPSKDVSPTADTSNNIPSFEEEDRSFVAQQDASSVGFPSSYASDTTSSASASASASTSTLARFVDSSSSSSLMRKLKPKKKFNEPLVRPENLRIERTISFDQTSHHTSSSSSIITISSGRPSELGYGSSTASQQSDGSQYSKNWKASEFDTSSLTEEELKKCKKKGINPALYAEMKAAKKGKWISSIGGNTIL